MKTNTENALVVKSNHIIEASYQLTLQEQRVILYMASQINKDDEDFQPVKINVSDFIKLINLQGESQYSEIEAISRKLRDRELIIREQNTTLIVGWLSSSEYFHKQGYVELCFDPKLKPYLLKLKERFTKYYLQYVIQFTHGYSIRIYELLKQYEPIGHRYFELDEFKYILGIQPDEYKLYNNFKARVIEPVKEEFIKKCSANELDILFTYTEKKLRKKVIGLDFTIYKNENVKPQRLIDEFQEMIKHTQAQQLEQLENEQLDSSTSNNEVLEKLLSMNLSKRQANNLMKKYPVETILSNYKYTRRKELKGEIDNVSAFLIEAIKNDYAKNYKPEDLKTKELRREANQCWNTNAGSCRAKWEHNKYPDKACYYCVRFKEYKK